MGFTSRETHVVYVHRLPNNATQDTAHITGLTNLLAIMGDINVPAIKWGNSSRSHNQFIKRVLKNLHKNGPSIPTGTDRVNVHPHYTSSSLCLEHNLTFFYCKKRQHLYHSQPHALITTNELNAEKAYMSELKMVRS